MHIGLTQYAACPKGEKFIENADRLGIEGIEPYIGAPDDRLLMLSPDELHAIRDQGVGLGIRIPSVCLGAFNNDASLIDSSGKASAVELVERVLDLSYALGANLMLLCSYVKSNPDTEIKKTNMIRVVEEILPYAAERDVLIALESPLAADELKEVVETINSDQVGVYFDTGNAVANGYDPVEEIEILDKDIFAVHIKDSHSLQLSGLHIGDGDVDFNGSVAALKKVEYDDWLMLETPGDDEAAVQEDIRTLRELWMEDSGS
jgi:hexulose-6-phosphate isomerase